ncbi:hypothetical protein VB713_17745 [Anabaena cylindrica UHCC 0172]|uniref:hypothetical protein n=1 Tax=Anabaena cylindrica TaxID=1165 RepID=UPI002B20047B|nr:hypothetical protein [Anabaena cylindrica]MEA5552789.1 hypothetical protein [Anabaena cylindrica UHCC 0172]
MNTNCPSQAMQNSFYTALGAMSAFTELFQEPQNLTNYLNQVQQTPDQLLQDLAAKGKNMEEDMANFVKAHCCGCKKPSSYPQYVEQADGQAFNQPYEIKGTTMYGFAIEASMSKLQDVCDKYLNNPSNGELEYRPVMSHVILTINNLDSLRSINPPDYEKGTVQEQEVVFWMLTVVGKKVGPVFVAERLAWFIPYIYVNNATPLVSGREVYGFFKQFGTVQMPKIDQPPDLFTLDTLVFKEFTPETKAIEARLLEVRRISQEGKHPAIKTWGNFEEAISAIANLLFEKNNEITVPGLGLPFNLLDYLVKKIVPLVNLKQFRDAEDSRRACYQALIESPMQLQTFHGGKLLGFDDFGDKFELTINKFASQPIVQDLGLHTGYSPGSESIQIPIKLAFLLNFDFSFQNGTAVWQAPQK